MNEITFMTSKGPKNIHMISTPPEIDPQAVISLSDGTKVLIVYTCADVWHEYDRYFTVKHLDEEETVLASFKYANIEQLYNGIEILFARLNSQGIEATAE